MGENDARADKLGAAPDGARQWFFGTAVLDERSLELSVADQKVVLERKPLEVLRFLLDRTGEVVTKDEIIDAVWGTNRILSDTVVTKAVGRLREVLGDDQQALIKTVHGYGYRLVAPVRVEHPRLPERSSLGLVVGGRPPLRALWTLERRLGAGGQGEAWLVRHDKTREARVFKFALDDRALSALKREITLFRLLRDTLGPLAPIVTILDWNLEQAPFFIESEFVQAQSIVEWVEACGGSGFIGIEVWIELVARIADALSRIHEVGVLHKDLKPSNVLVEPVSEGAPTIRLCDFGSGGMLNPEQLEALRITRMGFTRAFDPREQSSGTPLYLAPEVALGQPVTVKADIYALGVMLYQFAVGDLHKPFSAGWEREITDELLREDIAAAAEGDPAHRLSDASELARRLRSLDLRRQQRQQERSAAERVAAHERALERMRARRTGVVVAIAALTLGLVTSAALLVRSHRSQLLAEAESQRATAVANFIGKDIFSAIDSSQRSVRNLTVKELLDGAAAQVTPRFQNQPLIAADLRESLANAYGSLDAMPEAQAQMQASLELALKYDGESSDRTLRAAHELVIYDYVTGRLPTTLPRHDGIRRAGAHRLGAGHPMVLRLRARIALGRYLLGDFVLAADELSEVVRQAPESLPGDTLFIARNEGTLGVTQTELGRYADAERTLSHSLELFLDVSGEEHVDVAKARNRLATVYLATARPDEAQLQLEKALTVASQWMGAGSDEASLIREGLATVELLRGHPDKARLELLEVLSNVIANDAPGMDQTPSVRRTLAQAYLDLGKLEDAEHELRIALDVQQRTLGERHPDMRSLWLDLANVSCLRGRSLNAADFLRRVDAVGFDDLPDPHPLRMEWWRVQGQMSASSNEPELARTKLEHAAEAARKIYGVKHWRMARIQDALTRLSPGRAADKTDARLTASKDQFLASDQASPTDERRTKWH